MHKSGKFHTRMDGQGRGLLGLGPLAGHCRALRGRLKNVGVVGGIDNFARIFLTASEDAAYPVIRKHLIESCSLFRVHLQHAADDIPTFPRQDAEKSPRTLDDLLTLGWRLGVWRKWRGLFAGGTGGRGLVVDTCLADLLLRGFAGLVAVLRRTVRRLSAVLCRSSRGRCQSRVLVRGLRLPLFMRRRRQIWAGLGFVLTPRVRIR